MRVDKYLKVSRIIKRRTVANDACSAGRVSVNGKVVKAGYELKVGDIIEIRFGSSLTRAEVLLLTEHVRKEESGNMFRIIEETE